MKTLSEEINEVLNSKDGLKSLEACCHIRASTTGLTASMRFVKCFCQLCKSMASAQPSLQMSAMLFVVVRGWRLCKGTACGCLASLTGSMGVTTQTFGGFIIRIVLISAKLLTKNRLYLPINQLLTATFVA